MGAAAMVVALVQSFGIEVPYLSALFGDRGRVPGGKPAYNDMAAQNSALDRAAKTVRMHLNLTPQGGQASATVNGKPVNMSNPVMVVPVDSPLELVVQDPGFRTVQRQFVINSAELGDQKDWTMDVNLDPMSAFGYLSIRTTPPADATITINGTSWKKRTPFEKEKLPIGTYTVHLSNDLLEMGRDLQVEIKDGEVTQPFDPDRADSHEVKLNAQVRAPSSMKQ